MEDIDMVYVKEQVTQEIEDLSEAELQQVAEYLAFLKFRDRTRVKSSLDETQLAALYVESSDEDRLLAEGGMEEYAKGLLAEDTQ